MFALPPIYIEVIWVVRHETDRILMTIYFYIFSLFLLFFSLSLSIFFSSSFLGWTNKMKWQKSKNRYENITTTKCMNENGNEHELVWHPSHVARYLRAASAYNNVNIPIYRHRQPTTIKINENNNNEWTHHFACNRFCVVCGCVNLRARQYGIVLHTCNTYINTNKNTHTYEYGLWKYAPNLHIKCVHKKHIQTIHIHSIYSLKSQYNTICSIIPLRLYNK